MAIIKPARYRPRPRANGEAPPRPTMQERFDALEQRLQAIQDRLERHTAP
jgi:hypothetical protein